MIVASIFVFAVLVRASAYYATREPSYRRGVVVRDDPTVQEPDLGFFRTPRWWAAFIVSGIAAMGVDRLLDLLWPGRPAGPSPGAPVRNRRRRREDRRAASRE